MKTTILKLSAFVLLFALIWAGCKKDDNSEKNLVVKEFPVLHTGYYLKQEETVIIRDQETFDKVFSKELVTQISELQNIDFQKYDVLAGEYWYIRGISRLEHKFTRTDANSYLYKLDVIYNISLPVGRFCYGIIVEKLPSEATVKFEVNKVNE